MVAQSPEPGAHVWKLEVVLVEEGGGGEEKLENPEKNPRSKERTNNKLNPQETASESWIHSDEGLTLETSVFESFTVANLPYRPCG